MNTACPHLEVPSHLISPGEDALAQKSGPQMNTLTPMHQPNRQTDRQTDRQTSHQINTQHTSAEVTMGISEKTKTKGTRKNRALCEAALGMERGALKRAWIESRRRALGRYNTDQAAKRRMRSAIIRAERVERARRRRAFRKPSTFSMKMMTLRI
jgi:hypothetical protein